MSRAIAAVCLAAAAGSARADDLAYLPADTDAVVVIDAKKLAGSDFLKRDAADIVAELLKVSRHAELAVAASGLDPLKDIDRVVVGLNLDAPQSPRPFVLAAGSFEAKKVSAALTAYAGKNPKQMSAVKVGEREAFLVTGNREGMYAAPVADGLLVVAGSDKALADAFAAAAGTRKAVVAKELAALVAAGDPKAAVRLAAVTKGKFAKIEISLESLKKRLAAVDTITASIAVEKDLAVELRLTTSDAESAKGLNEVLQALLPVFQQQMKAAVEDQPELRPAADLIKSLRPKAGGKTVVVTGSIASSSLARPAKK